MRLRRHPGHSALNAWLTTGASARVGRHVDDCEHCLATLEQLTSLDDALVAELGEVVAPPRGIEGRTATAVERRLRDEDALMTFFDLFSVGWATTKVILDPEEGSDG